MTLFENHSFMLLIFNALVVFTVLANIYQELYAVIRFSERTMGKAQFYQATAGRLETIVYWCGFFVTLLISALILLSDAENHTNLVACIALAVGFFVNAVVSRICFFNEIGIGSVNVQSEMEFQWNEIKSFYWQNNVLHLQLRRKLFGHIRMRFSDSTSILLINERLHRLADSGVSLRTESAPIQG
ncbi:MAG TPA: hypothetical protein PKI67_04580 [bacterium]|nr:hypothetical protein [bacterium]